MTESRPVHCDLCNRKKKYFVMISTFCMPIMIVDLQCLNNCFKLVVFMLKKKVFCNDLQLLNANNDG